MKIVGKWIELAELFNGLELLIEQVEKREGHLDEGYYINRLELLRSMLQTIQKQMKQIKRIQKERI